MKLTFKGTPHLPEYRGLHDGQMVHVSAGGTVDVSDGEGSKLLADFPGVFVAAEEKKNPQRDRQIKAPAKDRQLKGADKAK